MIKEILKNEVKKLRGIETQEELQLTIKRCERVASTAMLILDSELENNYDLGYLKNEIYIASYYEPIKNMIDLDDTVLENIIRIGYENADYIIKDAIAITDLLQVVESLRGDKSIYDRIKVLDCIERYKYYIPSTKFCDTIAELIYKLMSYINYRL